jgi:3-phosphoshikimate 1-carboxyvinyltransferase
MQAVTVRAPASKSFSHRYVFAAALADGESLVRGVLDSDDLRRTMHCLSALGASFEREGGDLRVIGVAGRPQGGRKDSPADLDVGESGTTCRLVTAVAAAGRGFFKVHGAGRMHSRPIAPLAEALQNAGVSFDWKGEVGCPPFVMGTGGLPGGVLAVDASASSQYLSGPVLASPMAEAESRVESLGGRVASWPYVPLTLQVMADFGVESHLEVYGGGDWLKTPWRESLQPPPGPFRVVVPPASYRAGDYRVEGDWSNASYFCLAGAMGPRPVTITGVRPDSIQGDRAILDIVSRMGAKVEIGEDSVTVSPGELRGIDVDMGACPDLAPGVAVAASQARGRTRITGAAHLRIKESDRLAAPAMELSRIGCEVEVTADGLIVEPCPVGDMSAEFSAHGDHRMAMSLSLLALRGVDVRLDDPGVVNKSFPGFWEEWNKVAG